MAQYIYIIYIFSFDISGIHIFIKIFQTLSSIFCVIHINYDA